MANKTAVTAQDPFEYLATVPGRRRAEGEALLTLFEGATGATARMWGPSMIGFGDYRYRYPSGRTGEFFRVGFAPRKSALSLYGLRDHPDAEELLAEIGPFTHGAGCVYVKRLDTIDMRALRAVVATAFDRPKLHEE